MKDFLDKKITILAFKKQNFENAKNESEYPDPYFDILKIKLSNNNIFEGENIDLLSDIEEKINALEFSRKYSEQRNKDLNEDKKRGYTYEVYKNEIKNLKDDEKIFERNYSHLLHAKGSAVLGEYEQGLKALNIKGEIFFMDIFNFIDIDVLEYVPSDAEGFNPEFDTDEKTLRRRIQLAFDILERNKDRWMIEEQNSEDEKSKEKNGQKI